MTVIRTMYSQVLNMSATITDDLTFAEMGGDSRMAIEVTHVINSNSNMLMVQQPQEGDKLTTPQSHQANIFIQVSDVLLLSLKDICQKIIDSFNQTNNKSSNGDDVDVEEETMIMKNQKRRRLDYTTTTNTLLDDSQYLKSDDNISNDDSFVNDKLKLLDKKTKVTTIGESKKNNSNKDNEIQMNWQSHMLMCVDASPLLLSHTNDDIALVGSQGGDIVCLQISTGKTLFRKLLSSNEKIEGQMNYLIRTTNSTHNANQTLFFVSSYNSNRQQQQQQGGEKRLEHGYISAFELLYQSNEENVTATCSPSTIDCHLVWKKGFHGEIKSQPACFKLQRQQQDADETQYNYYLLTAGYDGVVSLLDALTGQIIYTIDDIGGAVHASPTIHKINETKINVYLVSSTWTGRISCIEISIPTLSTIQHSSNTIMKFNWHMDLYCPFYASPTILVRTDLTITKQSMTSKAITASNNDGNILILGGIDGRVRAIRINDDNGIKKEKEIWTFTSLNRKPIFTKCVLFMYNHHNQYVVFGSHDGSITCLSATDGAVLQVWLVDNKIKWLK